MSSPSRLSALKVWHGMSWEELEEEHQAIIELAAGHGPGAFWAVVRLPEIEAFMDARTAREVAA